MKRDSVVNTRKSAKNKRPANLDKRVFFDDEFSKSPDLKSEFERARYVQSQNLLWLWLYRLEANRKYKWSFDFDVLESGKEKIEFTEKVTA